MKSSLFDKVVFTCVLLLTVLFISSTAFAAEIKIEGSSEGLEVIPKGQDLFNEFNLYPGDKREGKVVVKNSGNAPFELYFRAERLSREPGEDEPDLYKQTLVNISLEGREVYDGSMIDCVQGDGLNLGLFKPGEVKEMEIVLTLPGPETGNEFMGLSYEDQWLFSAVNTQRSFDKDSDIDNRTDVDVFPKTGMSSSALFPALGVSMVGAGVIGLRKKRGKK